MEAWEFESQKPGTKQFLVVSVCESMKVRRKHEGGKNISIIANLIDQCKGIKVEATVIYSGSGEESVCCKWSEENLHFHLPLSNKPSRNAHKNHGKHPSSTNTVAHAEAPPVDAHSGTRQYSRRLAHDAHTVAATNSLGASTLSISLTINPKCVLERRLT
ncbi:uncharacterized protein G2W53_045248 [Senna tora]|uniref:Uncharacterized protein n=1 Tax=Senna tora TaxID=362788 RepID=A0A834VXY8_9FABA|nr:uncharacterized protein G2W53_045248 [Senna tora]